MVNMRLFRGVGEREAKALKACGLVPRDGCLYATWNWWVAATYAFARANREGREVGYVVEFEDDGMGWRIDGGSPESLKAWKAVPLENVISVEHITCEEYERLMERPEFEGFAGKVRRWVEGPRNVKASAKLSLKAQRRALRS
jgi:hypothetical protein